MARKSFDRGMYYYNRDDFDKAIEQFDIGYRLIPNSLFLFNIAQAHRLSNRLEKALAYYQRYLQDSPDAKNRGEVDAHIAMLEKQIRSAKGGGEPSAESLAQTEPAPAPLLPEQAADEKSHSIAKRRIWPIVVGVLSGAVVVGLAIGLGVYFGTRPAAANVFEPVTP